VKGGPELRALASMDLSVVIDTNGQLVLMIKLEADAIAETFQELLTHRMRDNAP
jgi:hypothetical protein